MMTLIGLAKTVAYVYSGAVTFGLEGTPFYWELATLMPDEAHLRRGEKNPSDGMIVKGESYQNGG